MRTDGGAHSGRPCQLDIDELCSSTRSHLALAEGFSLKRESALSSDGLNTEGEPRFCAMIVKLHHLSNHGQRIVRR